MGNVYLENEALTVENRGLVGIVQSQQAEIARLQAELVEANSCHETALSLANFGAGQITSLQAEVERLHRDFVFWRNEADERSIETNTRWNDAIEAAASIVSKRADELCDSNSDSGVVEEVGFLTDAIRALRKDQP